MTNENWGQAKEEAKKILIERAKLRGQITYTDLANQITSMNIKAHDPKMFKLLGEISSEEDAQGRGMLSVIVVHKTGDMQPGKGFFELAESLGRDTTDIVKCWVEEFKKVHAIWSNT